MAKFDNWDIIAAASYGTAWLILMGIFGGLFPTPWAWIALLLGVIPAIYYVKRHML